MGHLPPGVIAEAENAGKVDIKSVKTIPSQNCFTESRVEKYCLKSTGEQKNRTPATFHLEIWAVSGTFSAS